MKKIVAFCLFGNNPLYCKGMIENLKLMEEIYPDWIARIYYSNDVPIEYINEARKYKCELILKKKYGHYDGTLWRFLPLLDDNVDIWISRDCDSRISFREKNAVDEWIKSNKCLHIMRDHPHHGLRDNEPIQSGMFGINNIIYRKKYTLLEIPYLNINIKNYDNLFLFNTIWKFLKNDEYTHDTYGSKWTNFIEKPFPEHKPIKFGLYVGQIILEDNKIRRYKGVEEEYKRRNVKY